MIRGVLGAWFLLVAGSAAAADDLPVIDMHFHAMAANSMGPGQSICTPYPSWPLREPSDPIEAYLDDFSNRPDCPKQFKAPESDAELIEANAQLLERRNIIALTGGTQEYVEMMHSRAPERVMPAIGFGHEGPWPKIEQLRALHRQGKLKALSEVTTQYAGIAPTDAKLAPYWALAEELDIPIGLHMGPGAPGISYFGAPAYRMALTDPLQLEEVLLKHPKLRVFVMHAGWPMAERMIALMYAHPQVYVELGVIDHAYPRSEFHSYLKRLVDAGFGKRIMFGSDQMVWPGVIDAAIDGIAEAPFLSEHQKRDILYNNAARFLRFTPEQLPRITVAARTNVWLPPKSRAFCERDAPKSGPAANDPIADIAFGPVRQLIL